MKSQAKTTKALLNIAAGHYANKRRDMGKQVLLRIPVTGMELVEELASYEAAFVAKRLRKYVKDAEIQELTEAQVNTAVQTTKASVSRDRPAETLSNTYEQFTRNKIAQYERISDETPEEDLSKTVKEKTNGLFTWQNLAIAGVVIIAIANQVRADTAEKNGMSLQWSAILDNATCEYCESNDGQIFDNSSESDIPAHSNCRCSWIIVDEQ